MSDFLKKAARLATSICPNTNLSPTRGSKLDDGVLKFKTVRPQAPSNAAVGNRRNSGLERSVVVLLASLAIARPDPEWQVMKRMRSRIPFPS